MSEKDRLIAAVEGGTWDGSWRWLLDNIWDIDQCQPFSDAYHGSLDAAKALHDALLPDELSCILTVLKKAGAADLHWNGCLNPAFTGISANPARAWLLAILRAYRQQTEGGE